MNVVFVRLQCKQREFLPLAALLYQPFCLFLYLPRENTASVLGKPYQMVSNRVAGISGFTHL
ncbi:hypothetical protein KDW_60230 [Dictyobacter vulcani]|uniref:Uncharacterized protein n=1 Tax=Dictyobacter vulcani TaxID=2607529 RepID=A0A5J4KZG4_9CHLR|nr:hypothetical protein KDW_60230 [Dictyobacter vulcani]